MALFRTLFLFSTCLFVYFMQISAKNSPECPCVSYFGMNWTCLIEKNYSSYNFSENSCAKSVFKWMDARLHLWDEKLLPEGSWISVALDEAHRNCSYVQLIVFEQDPEAEFNVTSPDPVILEKTIIARNLSETECQSDYGDSVKFTITFGLQFFNFLTWTSRRKFSCFLDILGVYLDDPLWNSRIYVRTSTSNGLKYEPHEILPVIRIGTHYLDGTVVHQDTVLRILNGTSGQHLLDSVAIDVVEHHELLQKSQVATLLFKNSSMIYGVEVTCSVPNPAYKTESEQFIFKSYPHVSQSTALEQGPPRNLTLLASRVFENSTFLFTISWSNPTHWNSWPRHYVVRCIMLDSQFHFYPETCLKCLSSADKSGCQLCWEEMMNADPAAVFRMELPWLNTSGTFIFQTNFVTSVGHSESWLANSHTYENTEFQRTFRYGWHLAGHYEDSIDIYNVSDSYLSYMGNSVLLPGNNHHPTELSPAEVSSLFTLCRVRGKLSDRTLGQWSEPILVNHSNFFVAPKFAAVIQAADGHLILVEIEYFPADDVFIASTMTKLESTKIIPAVEYGKGGSSFIDEVEQHQESSNISFGCGAVEARVACYHSILDKWFAFVKENNHHTLAFYAGKTGSLVWDAISWNFLDIHTEHKPVQLRCAHIHDFIAWSEVTLDGNVLLKTLHFSENGSALEALREFNADDLCNSTNQRHMISTASFDLFFESLQRGSKDPEIGILCGNVLCTVSIFTKHVQSLATFDWLPNSATVTWISIDANHRFYLMRNDSNLLYIGSVDTGRLEFAMDKFYSPLKAAETKEKYPGFKSHTTDEYILNNDLRNGLKLVWQTASWDVRSYPVPPEHCIFPEVGSDVKISMISNSSVQVKLQRIWNQTSECQNLALPPVIYQVNYDLIMDSEKKDCSKSCNNGLLEKLDFQNFILLDVDSNEYWLRCFLECYKCSRSSCIMIQSQPSWSSSIKLEFNGPKAGSSYFMKFSIVPHLSKTTMALWYSGKELKARYAMYKATYSSPITKADLAGFVLGIALPLLLIIACLIGCMVWFYKNRWYLQSNLPRIALSDIKCEEKIGEGHFGEIWKATLMQSNAMIRQRTVKKTVVVKILKKTASERMKKEFREEALLISKFRSNFVIRPLGICMESRRLMLAMEYMNGGSLVSYLKTKEVRQALQLGELFHIVEDALKACEYLESEGYIHRDISARNCLVSLTNNHFLLPKHVKLTDFGLSKDVKSSAVYTSQSLEESCLPVAWSAPEAFDGKFSSKSDVFAFGVLMFEVFSWAAVPYSICSTEHNCPLKVLTHEEIEFSICVKRKTLLDFPHPCTACFSDALQELMQLCFMYDPMARPSFKKLRTFLYGAKAEINETEVPELVRNPPISAVIGILRAVSIYPTRAENIVPKKVPMMRPVYGDSDPQSNLSGTDVSTV